MGRIFRSFIGAALLSGSVAWAGIGGGDITFKVNGANDVVFKHEFHVQKKGLKCADCHNAIFKPKASIFSSTMEKMRNGEACGVCHNGKRAFDVRDNCARCHKG